MAARAIAMRLRADLREDVRGCEDVVSTDTARRIEHIEHIEHWLVASTTLT